MDKFKDYYKNTKEKIDEGINSLNKELEKEPNQIIKDNLSLLVNLNKDGKRIRGVLVNLGYYLLKENDDYANALAVAYEMFQTAILIHDDIIDNDNKRRGVDTVHYANYNKYKKYDDKAKHLGESIAICIGDYGLFTANKIIQDKYSTDPNYSKILSNFNNTILTTIRGELIDVILPFEGKHNLIKLNKIEENILEIYRLKTSYYTIIGPLEVGLLLADAKEEQLKDIRNFGEKVGVAFQIQDDILGIYSDEMGKVKGSDIREFKQTILYSHIINTEYKDEFMKYYGKEDITEENIKKIQELFIKSNSLEYATNMMNELYNESIEVLNNISWIKDNKKQLLHEFVEYLRNRNK